MNYFIDLFSPETFDAFSRSDRDVSGFRTRHQTAATRVKPGDRLICYLTRVSRWCGVLEVVDGPFTDDTPLFVPEADPFVVRFHVRPLVWLGVEQAVPVHDEQLWSRLTFTQQHAKTSSAWTGKVRGSLARLESADGALISQRLETVVANAEHFPLDDAEQKLFATHTVHRADKVVAVSVPDDIPADTEAAPVAEPELRESLRMQALLARIGHSMGLSIWIPRADRGGVLKEWRVAAETILNRLPLNYDDATLKTIENIDVLWLRGRAIVRAFEVEHTTAVYSGILRMADLLALQPNMNIKLHLVAPASKREKVFQEIRRPVFSLLDRGPLAESCTYLSYDSLRELAEAKHLAHLSDSVLDEYAEDSD